MKRVAVDHPDDPGLERVRRDGRRLHGAGVDRRRRGTGVAGQLTAGEDGGDGQAGGGESATAHPGILPAHADVLAPDDLAVDTNCAWWAA